MAEKKHLPTFGVGPLYGLIIVLVSIIGMILSRVGLLESGKVASLKIPFMLLGILFVVLGFSLWHKAVFKTKVDEYIVSNHLCTSGIYAYVRNPCYSGIMMICTGALLIANNLWLLILPFFYWLFMTLLMKHTEEKWLTNLHGQEYLDYCQKVNRCIPWFKR